MKQNEIPVLIFFSSDEKYFKSAKASIYSWLLALRERLWGAGAGGAISMSLSSSLTCAEAALIWPESEMRRWGKRPEAWATVSWDSAVESCGWGGALGNLNQIISKLNEIDENVD